MKSEREYIQEACREFNNSFADKGFVASKNGLTAKRKIDKDITQEISCQITSHRGVIIHFNVSSKKMTKWLKDQYPLKCTSVSGLGGQLGYITKQQTWKTWYIGKSDIARNQFLKEASDMITNYLMPYFDAFYDIPSMLKAISNQGSISKEMNSFIPPILFILQYGTIEQAQMALDRYLENNPQIYQTVRKDKAYFDKSNDFFPIPFMWAEQIKIAINNGLSVRFDL